ncbi:MAG: hypothetical protein RLZZ232_1512 [Planctomycetota bacterium]
MKNRKMLRRALLAAAVSTVGTVPTGTAALAVDNTPRVAPTAPARTPAQPASHNSGAVSGELNRLFQESGQEMPSMRSQDLPNARNMQSHLVRQKPAAPAPKKSMWQKFVGKITGRDRKEAEAEAAVTPPVPPLYKEPVAVPPPTGSVAGAVRKPLISPVPGQVPAQVPATQMPGMAKRPAVVPPVRNLSAPQPAIRPGTGMPALAAQPALAPAIPGAAVNPAARRPVANGLNELKATGKQYVQPGAAPAFMSAAATRAAEIAAPAANAAAAAADKGFVDPFEDADAPELSDPLDLEAIAKTMRELEATGEALKEVPTEAAAVAKETVAEVTEDAKAAAEEALENPFTGVGLDDVAETAKQAEEKLEEVRQDMSDADFFAAAAAKAAEKVADKVAADVLPGKVPELEDFSTDLPAISLPEVTEEAAESSFPSEPLQSIDDERVRIAKEQEERHNQLERILARADQTGFKGFCPVALRDQRQLVDADPELKAEFGLQTYTFSSAEAKAAFEANPTRYAPVAGGNDVVAEAADGVQKPGRLDYSLWYRDRLYLFESRENMAAFHQSPRKFAAAE